MERSSGRAKPKFGREWTADYAPVLFFTVVYAVTCLLGALLLLFDYRPFVALYSYFSGTRAPVVNGYKELVELVLLLACPGFLWIGYAFARGFKWPATSNRVRARLQGADLEGPVELPEIVFYGLAGIGVVSIIRAGLVTQLHSWLDYEAWIAARNQAFGNIGFLGFVNIYLLIPLSAAWVLLRRPPGAVKNEIQRWLPSLAAVALALLLFQKKAALVAVVIIASSSLLDASRRGIQLRKLVVLAPIVVMACLYFTLVVAPVYRKAAHGNIEGIAGLNSPAEKVPAIVVYSALSPLIRTSAPALYYPIVFPDEHPRYGLDLGQDVLGIGTMPNDNQVVWHHLNPNLKGTTTAPFQFVLYSQVGVVGALLGSLIAGILLSLAWGIARSRAIPSTWASLFGSMVLLLAVYLAIDSPRNSLLVSYGVLWGVLFILVAGTVVYVLDRLSAGAMRPRVTSARQ